MNICVFCSASDVDEKYTKPAAELATLVGAGGHMLVWGGSDKGTMKVIADAAQAAGGKISGVSVEPLRLSARKNADEMYIARDWPERRATLLAKADAIVVLAGGIGTLDEVTEVLEYKKQNLHNKAIVFVNTDGFYSGFKSQLERMDDEGFLPKSLSQLVAFEDMPEQAMTYIESYGG